MGANDNKNTNDAATELDVELVRRSMQWDEDAFRKVYEVTYYRMLYIAKKYMKNDTAAEDVLQEAYIKIWTNLPQLDKPEAYVSWASRIVANTALNELRKTQPILFSEMAAVGEDGSEMAFDVEDTYVPNQPELSYTEAEEQMLIREMIDSLSDEQRMCVLMYYMEDLSVRESAEPLGCSEGTVKSRLNYGRQNIKAKVEELQKKGYNFKGISAMALLLLLLGREAARMWAKPVKVSVAAAAPAAGAAVGTQAVAGVGNAGNAGVAAQTGTAASAKTAQAGASIAAKTAEAGSSTAAKTAEAGASSAAKAGFFTTLAGKITIAVASFLVIGGIILAILLMNKDKDDQPELEASNTTEITTVSTEQISTETDTEAQTTEADTEPETEEVTEEPAEYYAYVDAYLEVLQGHKDTIKAYEGISYLMNNQKSVAFADVNMDEIPELFFVEFATDQPRMIMYSFIDGKATRIECPSNLNHTDTIGSFQSVASKATKESLFLVKNGFGFYWEITDGPKIDSPVMKLYTLSGKEAKYEVISEAEAQRGAVIISNTELQAESVAMSYEDAEKYLKQMQIRNYHEAGWQKIDDNWYYYNKAGKLQTGWLEDDGKWYFLSATGEMCTGWKTIKGKTYYFNEKGAMSTGEVTIDSQKYNFDENGVLMEGAGHPEGDAYLKELAAEIKEGKLSDTQAGYTVTTDSVEYAYADLNQDGTDELILSGSISCVISFPDGKPHEVVGVGGEIRSSYTVLADGHILYQTSTMGSQTKIVYQLEKDGVTLTEVDSATEDRNGGAERMEALNNSLAKEMKLNYRKLSELE